MLTMQFNILYCFNIAFNVEQYGIMFNVGGGDCSWGRDAYTGLLLPLLSCCRKIVFKMTLHFTFRDVRLILSDQV